MLKNLLRALLQCFVRPYRAGDTITLSLWTCGVITTNKTDIYLTVPINKPVQGKGAVLSGVLTVRQNNNYLSSDEDISTFEVSTEVLAETLKIKITKSSGFGGVNNDTVAVYFRGTIKFV